MTSITAMNTILRGTATSRTRILTRMIASATAMRTFRTSIIGTVTDGLRALAIASARNPSVTVPMMDVRKVRMAVAEAIMRVSMRVRLVAVPRKIVFMAVMLVMSVGVCVRQRLVPVHVPVALGEMQRNADRHQDRCYPERRV